MVVSRSSNKKSPVGLEILQLALHILAALTPEDVNISVINEEMSDIDFSKDYDLVMISIMTATGTIKS